MKPKEGKFGKFTDLFDPKIKEYYTEEMEDRTEKACIPKTLVVKTEYKCIKCGDIFVLPFYGDWKREVCKDIVRRTLNDLEDHLTKCANNKGE